MKILGVCGAQGALLYKLRKYLVANIEPRGVFHTPKEEQWKLNFKTTPFVRCAEELTCDISSPTLIIGSPSCGHSSRFSYSRKKALGKPKEDETLNLFISMVDTLKPNGFVMENLPKLLDLVPLNEWASLLVDYDIVAHCHPVSIFGNSQLTRKRMILIGVHKKNPGILCGVDFSKAFSCRPSLKTCRELVKTIREPFNFKEAPTKPISMYYHSDVSRRSLSVAEVAKLWQTEFKSDCRWPMYGHKMKTLPGVYRNRWDTYPLTLRPSNRQFTPDGEIMGLEWYRVIMGFPKSFKIFYDEGNPTYWLNKGRVTFTKGATFEVGTWIYRLLRYHELV